MNYDWDNLVPVSDNTLRQADWWINHYKRRLAACGARGLNDHLTREIEASLKRWIVVKLTGMEPSWNTSNTETTST